jgi:hypothetical protein
MNNAPTDTGIPCNDACFKAMGFAIGQTLNVRDLWTAKDMPDFTVESSASFTPDPKGTSEGGCNMIRFSPA